MSEITRTRHAYQQGTISECRIHQYSSYIDIVVVKQITLFIYLAYGSASTQNLKFNVQKHQTENPHISETNIIHIIFNLRIINTESKI